MSAVMINGVKVDFVVKNELVFCDTLHLAEVFEKNHKDILTTVKNLPFSEFNESNFILSHYIDSRGRKQPCYNLTRDGFSLLVMGFTGERAYRWKVEFIKAFNMMFEELQRLKFTIYTNKIANLQAIQKSQDKHNKNVINGYKSGVAKQRAIIKSQQQDYDRLKDAYDTVLEEYMKSAGYADFDAFNQLMQRGMYTILEDTKRQMYQLSTELTLKFDKIQRR